MSKISMDKKYRTRDGLPVRILCLDMKDPDYPVVGLAESPNGYELMCCFTPEGRFSICDSEHDRDLIEVSPYEDFKIDEPVMVRDGNGWERRHFAGVHSNGKPMTWIDGYTSFTSGNSRACAWHECRRPTPEELAGK